MNEPMCTETMTGDVLGFSSVFAEKFLPRTFSVLSANVTCWSCWSHIIKVQCYLYYSCYSTTNRHKFMSWYCCGMRLSLAYPSGCKTFLVAPKYKAGCHAGFKNYRSISSGVSVYRASVEETYSDSLKAVNYWKNYIAPNLVTITKFRHSKL